MTIFPETISNSTGWQFEPAGDRSFRFTSPFTLGHYDQHLVFYVSHVSDDSFFISDFGETAMHARYLGVDISKQRRQKLNDSFGVTRARFDDWNQIVAEGPLEEASFALLDATKLALSLSFQFPKWQPKFHENRFNILVDEMLYVRFKNRLIRKPVVKGISGKEIEFSFGLQMDNRIRYISTLSVPRGSLEWSSIYKVLGKCTDAKKADGLNDQTIIFQDGADAKELGSAIALLSQCANVQTFSMAEKWAKFASSPL